MPASGSRSHFASGCSYASPASIPATTARRRPAGPAGRRSPASATCRSPRSAMKSIAAAAPASPSWFSVPVSQMNGARARVHEAHVWAEELVRRAEQEVAAEGAYVDGPVQRVVHGIDDAPGAGLAGQLRGTGHVVDGAHGVGGIADGDDFGALGVHQ